MRTLQHVKFAGGLAQFIAEDILPLKEVLPYERAPEVHKDLLLSIHHLFRATGQSIACRQVLCPHLRFTWASRAPRNLARAQRPGCRPQNSSYPTQHPAQRPLRPHPRGRGQAQNKGMSQALLGKLFAAAAKLLAQANLILKGDALKNDFKGACLLLHLSPSAPASSYT